MQILKVFLLSLFFSIVSFAQSAEILQFKTRIGFTENDERTVAQKFLDGDNRLVLVGKKSVQFWDVPNAKLIESHPHEIPNLNKWDTSIIISPDGQKAIVLDSFSWRLIRKEKKVSATVWDLQTGKQIAVLERPTESIREAEWSKNGETLVTYSGAFNDKRTEICFWDGKTLAFRNAVSLKGYLQFRQLSRNGEKLFTARDYGTVGSLDNSIFITVWNTQTGRVEQNLVGGNARLDVAAFPNPLTANEKFFAAQAYDYSSNKLYVWEIGGSDLPKYEIAPVKKDGAVWFQGFSDDGKFLIANRNKTLEFYDAKTGELKNSLPNIKPFQEINLLADGKTLAVRDCNRADVFDLQVRQKLYELKLVCKSDVTDIVSTSYRDFDILQFHPNSKFLLTFSDKTVRVWSVANGNLLQTMVDPHRAEKKRKDTNKDDGLGWSAGWVRNGDSLFASGAAANQFCSGN